VSRYYTPLGRSIQRSYSNGSKTYYENAARRYYGRDSVLADTSKLTNGKKFKTKNGKIVLEGGGIAPDYFIAGDPARLGNTTAKLFSRGLLNTYGYKFAIDHADLLKQFKTPAEFSRSFSISDSSWKYFIGKAQRDTIDLINISAAEKNFLVKTFKLSVARQLWRHEGYFNVFNKEDPMVTKAIDLLSGKKQSTGLIR
jgi:carboxyl-terminal processing protease